MMVKDLERLRIMRAVVLSIGSIPCSRYARNGVVQSSSGSATATRVCSGSSGTPRSTSFGGGIEGLLMTSRKTPGGGACLEDLIRESASASSFLRLSIHSTEKPVKQPPSWSTALR